VEILNAEEHRAVSKTMVLVTGHKLEEICAHAALAAV
jgi:hypothetical protein